MSLTTVENLLDELYNVIKNDPPLVKTESQDIKTVPEEKTQKAFCGRRESKTRLNAINLKTQSEEIKFRIIKLIDPNWTKEIYHTIPKTNCRADIVIATRLGFLVIDFMNTHSFGHKKYYTERAEKIRQANPDKKIFLIQFGVDPGLYYPDRLASTIKDILASEETAELNYVIR